MSALDRSLPWLAIEASSAAGGVALFLPSGQVDCREVAMGASAADGVYPAIEAVFRETGLTPRDLGAVACGEGPGSFTSLRIGAALAKGLAHGLAVPLYAFPSLALVAASLEAEVSSGKYLVHSDALRGERYVLLVERGEDETVEPSGPLGRRSIDDLRGERDVPLIAAGESPDGLHSAFAVRADLRRLLMVRGPWLEAPVDLASWEPRYGRLAEAQVKWEVTHGRTLPPDGLAER